VLQQTEFEAVTDVVIKTFILRASVVLPVPYTWERGIGGLHGSAAAGLTDCVGSFGHSGWRARLR
jgi:hypothetical protein